MTRRTKEEVAQIEQTFEHEHQLAEKDIERRKSQAHMHVQQRIKHRREFIALEWSEEHHNTATKLQAIQRGRLTRRAKDEDEQKEEEIDPRNMEWNEEHHSTATKLQAIQRGRMTRRAKDDDAKDDDESPPVEPVEPVVSKEEMEAKEKKEKEKLVSEVENITKNSEDAKMHQLKLIKQQEKKADARVQARLAARTRAKKLRALSKSEYFDSMSDRARDTIIDHMEYAKFNTGDVVFKENDDATSVFLLIAGHCSVTINSQSVATLKEMDLFGEGALLHVLDDDESNNDARCKRGGTIVATSDIQLLVLSIPDFNKLVKAGHIDVESQNEMKAVAEKRAKENEERGSK